MVEQRSFLEPAIVALTDPNVSVISFDFFDTLVKRTAINPTDFFMDIGQRLAESGIILPHISPNLFMECRIAAESRARQKCAEADGSHEVSLRQIWNELGHILTDPSQSARAADLEFKIELDAIFENPLLIRVLEDAQVKYQKKVISGLRFRYASITQDEQLCSQVR